MSGEAPGNQSHQYSFAKREPVEMYAAFLDVLGFSAKTIHEFDDTVKVYEELINSWNYHYEYHQDVSLTIYSDSLLLTSAHLGHLVGAINTLHMVTTMADCLLRGGVAFGRHIELRDRENIFVVSEALTLAAQIERQVTHPCVAFHESVRIPEQWWVPYRPDVPNLLRPVLYFDNKRIVNPFNQFWYQSAAVRAGQLATKYPEHQRKYDWFLDLHIAVSESALMIPPDIPTEHRH